MHDFERIKSKAQQDLELQQLSINNSQYNSPGANKIVGVGGAAGHSNTEHVMRKSHNEILGGLKGTAAPTPDDQQAGAGDSFKLSKDIQLNLQNLTQIDEKFSQLADCLKKNNVNNISQLCSDWWEFTDEDDYTVAKF